MAELEIRWSGGSLDLLGWNESESGEFELLASADGVNFGNPEPVRSALRSSLLDGSPSIKERDENRVIEIELLISAATSHLLAEGERALALLDGRRCELAWTPPDHFGPTAVFVVVSTTVEHSKVLVEELALLRRYTLTLVCLPHARSADPVVIEAVTAGAAPTITEDCDTTTDFTPDWSNLRYFAKVGDRLELRWDTGGRTGHYPFLTYNQPAPVVPAGHPYFVVRMQASRENVLLFARLGSASGAQQGLYMVASYAHPSGGMWCFFATGNQAVYEPTWFGAGASSMQLYEMGWADSLAVPIGYQQRRLIEVPGSARAAASLHVSGDVNLGEVAIYTGPEYNPALMNFDNASATPGWAAEASSPTGAVLSVAPGSTALTYSLSELNFPRGDYGIWLLALGDDTYRTVTVEVEYGAGVYTEVSRSSVFFPSSSRLVHVGGATFPPFDTPGGASLLNQWFVRIAIIDGLGPIGVRHVLGFNMSEGSLTVLSGTSGVRDVWLDAPTLDHDRPGLFVNQVTLPGDKANSRFPFAPTQVVAWTGNPALTPPQVHLYTLTTGALDAEVAAEFYPAFHTHPTQ